MSCFLGCFSYCCCDLFCCQCNNYIFPAPRNSQYTSKLPQQDSSARWEFSSFNSGGRNVPYLKISSCASIKSKKCFIYFHGNGQDIGFLGFFLQPLFQATDITFYAIEYPTYGQYRNSCKAFISNKIKEDALNFYDFLLSENRKQTDIYIMGRSIGSGGATYLAGNKPSSILILISPFDSIKNVTKTIIGCLGCIVKQHFDNLSEIVKFKGKLLVIHGQMDEVIQIRHAKNLVKVYQATSDYKNKATTVYPLKMTHNRFSMREDIIQPIINFMNVYTPKQ